MGHCPYEKLADIADVLDAVRAWSGIKEKSPGVFYVKSTPFLHFHEKDGARWADVREGKEWGQPVDLPFKASKAARTAFQREVKRRYDKMTKSGG